MRGRVSVTIGEAKNCRLGCGYRGAKGYNFPCPSDSGESSWEEVSEEEEEEEPQEEKKAEEQVDSSAPAVPASQSPAAVQAAKPAVAKEKEEEPPEVKGGIDSPVIPSKPKYATHEEAKTAFKELLREKVCI